MSERDFLACFAERESKEMLSPMIEIKGRSVHDVVEVLCGRYPELGEDMQKGKVYVDIQCLNGSSI